MKFCQRLAAAPLYLNLLSTTSTSVFCFPEAIPEREKAVELWGGNEPQSLSMLAAMYSEVGRFSDAAGHGEPLPWRQLKMMCPFLRTFALESPTMSGK
jgi:hypothetical protein